MIFIEPMHTSVTGETDRYSRAANQKGKGYQMGYYPKRKESPKGPLTKKERVTERN